MITTTKIPVRSMFENFGCVRVLDGENRENQWRQFFGCGGNKWRGVALCRQSQRRSSSTADKFWSQCWYHYTRYHVLIG